MHEQIVQLDNKIVAIRKQFDPNKIERSIKQKADKIDLMTKFDDHDQKINLFNSNFVMLASDFTQFLSQMAKINKKLEKLSLINQDVLLGRRNANCISCAKSDEKKF